MSQSFATPAVLPNRSCILPNAIMPFMSLSPCFTSSVCTARSSRRQHAVESFDTSCSVLAFLLVSLQYPSCTIVNEHSVRHAIARVDQQTHGLHLTSLVLTSRLRHTPLNGILQLEEIVSSHCSPVSSSERNARQCRVQRTTSSSQ